MSALHRGMCQLEKPPANEITELVALTVCKQEFNKGENERKKTYFHKTEEQVPQRGHVKEALVSDNEESDDEE